MLKTARKRIKIEGAVKDSGFGLFVYKLAESLGIAGFIDDESGSVVIEAEGKNLNKFIKRVFDAPRPAVVIDRITEEIIPTIGETIFKITGNDFLKGIVDIYGSPDVAVCERCHSELFNSKDPRYNYPFISCPDCGYLFSAIETPPAEKKNILFSSLTDCKQCRTDFFDPLSPRFHHHRISCPDCGPRIWLTKADEIPSFAELSLPFPRTRGGTIEEVRNLIGEGRTVVLYNRNAYSLVCSASSIKAFKKAVSGRDGEAEEKYLLFYDVNQCREYFSLNAEESGLIGDKSRPVLTAQANEYGQSQLKEFLDSDQQAGITIASSPLEYLISRGMPPLAVFTGVRPGEAPGMDLAAVSKRFGSSADYFLLTNANPAVPMKPTRMKSYLKNTSIQRLAAGKTPFQLDLPYDYERSVLAAGGDINNSFCLLREHEAVVSHNNGSLNYLSSYQAFEASVIKYLELYNFSPDIVVADLQPDYLISNWASRQRAFVKRVQHHTAHAAACMAENGIRGKAAAVVFDGGGYGSDGELWGGEFFSGSIVSGIRRAGHLEYFQIPSTPPGRENSPSYAVSLLRKVYGANWESRAPAKFLKTLGKSNITIVEDMLEQNFNCRAASSAGKLLQAASSLLCPELNCGRPEKLSLALEKSVSKSELTKKERITAAPEYDFETAGENDFVLQVEGLVEGIIKDLLQGRELSVISWRIHHSLAWAAASAAEKICGNIGSDIICLTGGTFQNLTLLQMMTTIIESRGLRAYTNRKLPFGDGNLSLGQAVLGGF